MALTVWYRLVERHEVGRMGLLLFLVPVIGLAVATTVFREPIAPTQLVGVALTVGGLAALARERRDRGTGQGEEQVVASGAE